MRVLVLAKDPVSSHRERVEVSEREGRDWSGEDTSSGWSRWFRKTITILEGCVFYLFNNPYDKKKRR